MPFKSKSQMRYMFATMPKTAKKWAKHTPDIKSLPGHLSSAHKALASMSSKRKKK